MRRLANCGLRPIKTDHLWSFVMEPNALLQQLLKPEHKLQTTASIGQFGPVSAVLSQFDLLLGEEHALLLVRDELRPTNP